MNCANWYEAAPGEWVCGRCKTPTPPGRRYNAPPMRRCAVDEPCVYFGVYLREKKCGGCGGSYGIYSCEKHGECAVSRRAKEITVCGTCPSYEPLTEGTETDGQ
jgi:hypothetical protein